MKFEQLYEQYRHMSDKNGDIVTILHKCLTMDGEARAVAIIDLIKINPPVTSVYLLMHPERILDVPTQLLADFNEPMSYYCDMMANQPGREQLDRIVKHFHQVIQRQPINLKNSKNISDLYGLLSERLKEELDVELSFRVALVCLYCQSIISLGERLQQKNLSANQYFKLNFWLECLIQEANPPDQLKLICSLFLIKSLNRHLNIKQNEGETNFAVGQFDLIMKVYTLAIIDIEQKNRDLLQYVILQLQLLNKSAPLLKLKQLVDSQSRIHQLQLYNSILYMPEQLRVVLLRRILFVSLTNQTEMQLNLDDLKRLIIMADNDDERLLYIRQLLLTGGEECQTFIELVASVHPSVRESLLKDRKSLN